MSSNLYTALVVEDCTQTGPLLISFINNELPRLLSVPNPLVGPRNPRTGVPFADSNDEPGQGQLVQLRRIISVLESELRSSGAQPVDAYPKAVLFPQEEIPELIRTAKRYTPGFGDSPEEDKGECQTLRRLIDRVCRPDILIVDLAMSDDEGASILPEGFAQFDRDKPVALSDPRASLRNLTGFKLIRAFAHAIPVIATTHLSNPLIAQHCLVNGAFAFVHKPVPSVHANEVDFTRAWERSMRRMDLHAKQNANILDVVVTNYLTNAAAEVVKAMGYKWISNLYHS